MDIVWLTSLLRGPGFAALAVIAVLGSSISRVLADDDPGLADLPPVEVLAADGAAIEAVLGEVGLDAAWRSATGLGPIARALEVVYRGNEGDGVALLLTTAVQFGQTHDAHTAAERELREVAMDLNHVRETERRREISRNRAEAHFRGAHALMEAVALRLFAGGNPAGDTLLGLDGAELTIAHRTHELTNLTLDEMIERRYRAEEAHLAAVEAHDAAVRARIVLEREHAQLSASASDLAREARDLETTARAILPIAAAIYALADVPREPELTPRALDAYVRAEQTMTELQPRCRISWSTLAAVSATEGSHGAHDERRLTLDGTSDRDIIGLALDGSSVDNFGETVALIPDTDEGLYDGDPVHDRAVGPLQFIPDTWERWQSDGDGDGEMDPQDIDDAALSAAAYLCNYGSLRSWDGWKVAVFGYNHSPAYVNSVKASLDRVRRVRLPAVDETADLQPSQPSGTWIPLPIPDPEAEEGSDLITAEG